MAAMLRWYVRISPGHVHHASMVVFAYILQSEACSKVPNNDVGHWLSDLRCKEGCLPYPIVFCLGAKPCSRFTSGMGGSHEAYKVLGALALLMMLMGLVPMGCSNTVGPVRVSQTVKANNSRYPDRTVERFQECVTEHAAQLGPGNHALDATMDMDEDGLRYNVEIANLPMSGEDFGGCMRSALEDMAI